MNDDTHTQAQLRAELAELRQQVAEFEAIQAAYHQTQSRLQECEQKLNNLLAQSINGIAQAVAEPERNEQTRLESEVLYHTLLEYSPAGIFLLDNTYRFINANDTLANMLGYPLDELIGLDFRQVLTEPYREIVADRYRRRQRGETVTTRYEIEMLCKDGEVRYGEITGASFSHETYGTRTIGQVLDITEHKRAEHARAENEMRYKGLFEQMNDAVFIISLEGIYLSVNQRGADMLGYSVDELVGKPYLKVVAPNEQNSALTALIALKDGDRLPVYERIFKRKNGEEFPVEMNVALVKDLEGNPLHIQAVVRDITERKQAEAALRKSEERYRRVSELTTDYAYSFRVDPDGTYHPEWLTEDALYRMIGVRVDDYTQTIHLYHPDDEKLFQEDIERVLKGQATQREYRILLEDGEQRWLHISRYPVWDDEENRVVRFYGAGRDVTEQKRAEQQRLELALEKERSEAMRTLIGNISHDIKTPLTTINTSLYLLQKQTDPVQRAERIKHIAEQVHTMEGFIQDLLALSRLDGQVELHRIPVDLNQLIVSIGRQLRPTLESKKIDFVLDLDEVAPPINADQSDIRRALTNLVENAINYTPSGGMITVRTSKHNGEVVVEISDTGIGINSDDLPHIFDRFYRSPQAQSMTNGGSGLGLAIVQKVIEMHQGEIAVESLPQTGSTFRVLLPAI